MPDTASTKRIPTNLRTLLLLEEIGRADGPVSASELGQRIGLTKQTAHRLCTTLETEGFLIRPGGAKKFSAARRLREMGAGLLHHSQAHIARRQILMQVARDVGETVNFVVATEMGMSYLDRVETDWAFRIQLPIGSHVPFHCTASGKTFLASMPRKRRTAFVEALTLDALTRATHTAPETLLEDLERIRERGYALDDQEFIDGMVAIAVPVTDDAGRFIAALAYHGPTPRVQLDRAVERVATLQDAASRLRQVLAD